MALFVINLGLGLTLAALIAWRLLRLWAERKSGRAGARLHVRLVTWFAAVAIVPAILVAIFASVTLNLGLDAMFSGRVNKQFGYFVSIAEGFDSVGFAPAIAPPKAAERLAIFLGESRHGTMDWMERNVDRRADPKALWPEAKTAIVLGMNYGPRNGYFDRAIPADRAAISTSFTWASSRLAASAP